MFHGRNYVTIIFIELVAFQWVSVKRDRCLQSADIQLLKNMKIYMHLSQIQEKGNCVWY